MASAWNIVQASKYGSMPDNANNENESPLPDKFLRKSTMNTLRMSLRQRVPLKRMNGNVVPQQRVESAASHGKSVEKVKRKKMNAITVEKSMKKTFYKVTEQFTGTSRKTQLKDTPQKTTKNSYRDKLRSPVSPMTPINPFDSPSTSTPNRSWSKSRRLQRRSSSGRRSTRKTPGKNQSSLSNSEEFSRHLELVSCGIQKLEANANKMQDAICHDGVSFSSTPLRSKMRACRRKDRMNTYAPVKSSTSADTSDESFAHPTSLNTATGKIRRTVSRMSMRVRTRHKELRSSKSTTSLPPPQCYIGPLGQTRKLSPLLPSYNYVS